MILGWGGGSFGGREGIFNSFDDNYMFFYVINFKCFLYGFLNNGFGLLSMCLIWYKLRYVNVLFYCI